MNLAFFYIHLKMVARIQSPPHLQIRTNTTTPPLKKYINKNSVYITFRLYIQKNFHRLWSRILWHVFKTPAISIIQIFIDKINK